MNLREKLVNISISTQNETKKIIVDNLLNSFNNNVFLNIEDFSKTCYLSKSAISKFSLKFGFSGYRELINRLKFERENYSEIMSQNLQSKSFAELKNYFIDYINFFDRYEKDLDNVRSLLNNKTIIVSSNQLFEKSKLLYYYLRNNNNEVELSDQLFPNYNVDVNTKDCTFLFFTGGMEVEGIFNLYNKVKSNNKIVFFTSYALSSRIDKYDVKIIFDKDKNSTNIFHRSTIVGYLVSQLINKIT
ncbi:hypothetical protein [Spiroplasma turonicum]|uniref:Putative transcriptional regulator n=1 Tax=Spiroplasma turonicum TaxID=216946 RepID=A0A0K1P7M5_9MOLU|nr:hypothetical protein [Spiroplasma turonicum]AKU79887.1 putative transcriptional regulator [Spiroplasma turonicum]ALX70898.1 hypothetical protein STURO_v1c06390 [Spiroplasma turonicum]